MMRKRELGGVGKRVGSEIGQRRGDRMMGMSGPAVFESRTL